MARQHVPTARIAILDNVGHFPMLRPETVYHIIARCVDLHVHAERHARLDDC
jgi:hypothetical protein